MKGAIFNKSIYENIFPVSYIIFEIGDGKKRNSFRKGISLVTWPRFKIKDNQEGRKK
jgi:hypothetical protein